MPTVTVRPTATALNDGGIVTGPSAEAATSDDSDATYITYSDSKATYLTCGLPTLPAGGKWKQARGRMRARGTTSGRQATVEARATTAAAFLETSANVFTTGSFAEYSTSYMQLPDAAILDVTVYVGTYASSAENLQVAEAYLDFVYAAQPTCTVTAPSGVIATTTQPLCAATHTPGTDGGGQSAAQYRVYNAAQYGAAGFNPDFSTPFWGTDISGSASSATPGINLVDDSYRCYVRTAQSINGQPHWSAWDFEAFTVSTTPPDGPSISVTADNAMARNRITVTIDPLEASVVQVQRSADSGASWSMVRGATRINVVGSTWVGYDDETAGNGEVTAYRAQAIRPTVNGDIASAWSSTVTATWSSIEVWLKDPERPSRNRIIMLMSPAPQPMRPARKTDHEILGRRTPVTVSDKRGSARASFSIESYDLDEQAAIIQLFDDAPILLLQTPAEFGLGSLYVSPGDLQELLKSDQLVLSWRGWSVPYVVVDEPADAGVEGRGGLTIDDLGALYTLPGDIPASLTFDDFV